MSRFGDLLGGQKPAPTPVPAPEPVVEEVLVTPEEEVLTEANPLEEMSKNELEEYGRELGVELDKRHSKKRLISEIKEVLDNS
jgi:hypothetical protein